MKFPYQLVPLGMLLMATGSVYAQARPPSDLPEPSMFGLLAIGAIGLLAIRLHKRK